MGFEPTNYLAYKASALPLGPHRRNLKVGLAPTACSLRGNRLTLSASPEQSSKGIRTLISRIPSERLAIRTMPEHQLHVFDQHRETWNDEATTKGYRVPVVVVVRFIVVMDRAGIRTRSLPHAKRAFCRLKLLARKWTRTGFEPVATRLQSGHSAN